MTLEEHLESRKPVVAPRSVCLRCRRTLNVGELGGRCGYCRDCIHAAWGGIDLKDNSRLIGLSTPIGELPEVISERRARYLELVALLEKWSNEPGDYDERVGAILDEALATPDYAAEIARITPDAATLSRIAAAHPPPQSWYDETVDPTVPATRTPLGARLAALRRRMLAAGVTTISWDDLDRELGRERGA